MAIKEFISLEGVDEVKKSLKDLGTAGEKALSDFRSLGQSTPGLDSFTNSVGQATRTIHEGSASTVEFREGLHLLRPILTEAGIATGAFGEFAIAARAGIVGLAVAVVGTLVVALAKMAESSDLAKEKISDLLQSKAAGATAFGILQQDAAKLGVTVDKLIPSFTTLQRASQDISSIHFFAAPGKELPETVGGFTQAAAAATQLFTALRAGHASFTEAQTATDQFTKSLEQTGKVTGALLVPIREQFPAAFNLLKTALGGAAQTDKEFLTQLDKHPKSFQNLITALAAVQRQLPETFDPKAPQSLKDSVDLLFASVKNHLEESLSGQSFATGLRTAIGAIGPIVNAIIDNIVGLGRIVGGVVADFGKLGSAIAGAFKTGDLGPVFSALGSLVTDFVENTITDLKQIGQELIDALGAQEAWDNLKAAAQSAWDSLKETFSTGVQAIGTIFSGFSWSSVWDGLIASAKTAMDLIQGAWQAVVNFINSTQLQVGSAGGGPSVAEFAGGGFVRGPGTSTSDSILAWLSNNEFVMKAAAVRHYGADLMHAINSMQLPKNFFRGFNMGGLVMPRFPSPPRFAQGGLAVAGGGRHFTISFDGRNFPVTGSKSVVDELERAADLHNLSRMGRAPGWVR